MARSIKGLPAAALVAVLTQPAHAEDSVLKKTKDLYVACVHDSFYFTHLDGYARDGNVMAAAERSFADCKTEESALITSGANMMSSGPLWSPEQAILKARAMVDRLKVSIKSDLTAGLTPNNRSQK